MSDVPAPRASAAEPAEPAAQRAAATAQPVATARPAPLKPVSRSIATVGVALTVSFAILAMGAGYWQVFQSQDLSAAPDNPAVLAAARNVVRGEIVDRDGVVLAMNKTDKNGEPYRLYLDRAISPVVGYASKSVDGQILPDGGEIVEQDNIGELALALRRWLDNPEALQRKRNEARETAVQRFDIRKLSLYLWDEYERVVGSH